MKAQPRGEEIGDADRDGDSRGPQPVTRGDGKDRGPDRDAPVELL